MNRLGASYGLAFRRVHLSLVTFTDARDAVLKVSIAIGSQDLLQLGGVQLTAVAIGE
jgi:hypothetical protein